MSPLLLLLLLTQTVLMDDDVDIDTEDVAPQGVPEASTVYVEPDATSPGIVFAESFGSAGLGRFTPSTATKDGVDADLAKYDGRWQVAPVDKDGLVGDLSLIMRDKARHHAIAATLDVPFKLTSGKPLVFQYEVKHQSEHSCGGAYVKLLSQNGESDFAKFHDKTPYTIMFGPDRCGADEKLHFIIRHVNPVTGSVEEKHASKPDGFNNKYFEVGKTHVYRLVIHPDSSFDISVDKKILKSGHLLSDLTPAIIPEELIDDPADTKPEDWDERAKIENPEATKPDDWDEDAPKKIIDTAAVMPEGWLKDEDAMIPDPTSEKPSDWDDEMDGDWEAPLIDNPACQTAPGCGEWKQPEIDNPEYKGKWRAPMIDNPDYRGIWKPRKIKNPDYFEEANPIERLTPIAAVGLELWTMSDNVAFDNFVLAHDVAVVDRWTKQTYDLKVGLEGVSTASTDGESVFGYLHRLASEHPVMWAVYILVCLLPIGIIYILCCRGGDDQEEEDMAAAAQRKKTDEPIPDVVDKEEDKQDSDDENEQEQEEEEQEQEEEVEDAKITDPGAGGDPAATKSKSKSALDG